MKSVLLCLVIIINTAVSRKLSIRNPILHFEPCLSSFLKSWYNYGSNPVGEENQYDVRIHRAYASGTLVTMELDAEAIVELSATSARNAIISVSQKNNTFIIIYTNKYDALRFTVKGLNGIVPYFNSLKINGIEECHTPMMDYLDLIVKDITAASYVKSSLSNQECGKRKVKFIELIVNGETTSPGEWPWHAAIYRQESVSNNYICGGTLISKLFVLTAAHCATINNVPLAPDIMSVVLGKYHLVRDDLSSQRREVFSIKIHEDFGSPERLDNDIALLKLKTEAIFNDYIQPACLWTDNINMQKMDKIFGSIAGWGYSQTSDRTLSPELRHASLPMISNKNCTENNFLFYGSALINDRKFCAGWGNGTSPCNGDSGSGFLVQVPNTNRAHAGTWYIRGITSMTRPMAGTRVCDPTKYVVFTDTSKYVDWIRMKVFENILH